MSAPVDDFDLDIRIGEPIRILAPVMVTKTTGGDWCDESHCPTCGSACNTEQPPRCTKYC